jgi:hypothetical protein
MTWKEAKAFCESNGLELAILSTEHEMNVLHEAIIRRESKKWFQFQSNAKMINNFRFALGRSLWYWSPARTIPLDKWTPSWLDFVVQTISTQLW